jgi:hypothetical protein
MDDRVSYERSAPPWVRLARALRARLAPPPLEPERLLPPSGRPARPRHQDALAVLTAARQAVRRGWVQDAWYVLRGPDGRRRSLGPTSLIRLDHAQVERVCLVGAVLHAAWQQSPRAEHAHPAIDALWRTLHDRPGTAGAAAGDPVGPVSSPAERAARVRDLTGWNDRRDRTREDVLRLLDRTTSRITGARDDPA